MSHMPPEARGTREFSSPEVRVRSEQTPPFRVNQRLLLPNERRRRFTLRRIARVLLPLLVLGGIGVGVYFGVYYLLRDDETAVTPAGETAAQSETAAPAAEQEAAPAAEESPAAAEPQVVAQQDAPAEPAAQTAAQPAEQSEPAQQAVEPVVVHAAQAPPTVATEAVTPAMVGGAPLVGERMTAEALPAGIPRQLADDTPYDPADATAAFSNIWPTGTTLRLTRLPGAPALTEDQAAQVVDASALVVVRGSESSNTDIQLSAAAFELLGFYQTERIIAVRVEVVGPPP